jgi:tetratricopeptide (TPR) repeat protein
LGLKKLGTFLLLATVLVGCESADPVQKASPELQRQYNAAFQKMLNDPGNLDVVMAYAQVATKTGDYEGAVGAYESLLLVDSNLPRVKLELGILYYRLKSYDTSRISKGRSRRPLSLLTSASRRSCCWRRCRSSPSPSAPDP